jgi:hypothetical protein
MTTRIGWVLASIAFSSLAACSSAPEDVSEVRQDVLSVNGLTPSVLSENGLSQSADTLAGLAANGLTLHDLGNTPAALSALDSDPSARLFFSYIVGCALPAGRDIVFPRLAGQADYTFAGSIGLSPYWGQDGSSCDTTCQERVSACVIARVNYLGQHVPLSLRGSGLAAFEAEVTAYPNREATYYGNVLTSPAMLHGCRTTGDDWTLIGRPCGNGAEVSGCVIDVVDPCESRCAESFTDGSWGACGGDASDGIFVPAVTVYRQ